MMPNNSSFVNTHKRPQPQTRILLIDLETERTTLFVVCEKYFRNIIGYIHIDVTISQRTIIKNSMNFSTCRVSLVNDDI